MKPEHQWETRRHFAIRVSNPVPPDWMAGGLETLGPRAECYTLRFHDGREGRAALGLDRQRVDARSLEDPDLVHAVMAWLAARGSRAIHLFDDSGTAVLEREFAVHELDTAAPGAERIVTLAPSNAELVEAFDALPRLLACEDSSDLPADYEHIERLGPDLGPDLDRVRQLQPDAVISSLSVPGMERVVTGLAARGIPQIVLAPKTIDDVLRDVERVGDLLQCLERAATLRDDLVDQRRQLVQQRPAHPVRVYLEWWPRPMFTPGADCYSNELIALAGGINVFSDRSGASVQIEPDELLAADPDVCFVSWCGVPEHKLRPDNLIERPGLERLRAGVQGRVFAIDERFTGRPGPRMLEAARRMAAALAAMNRQ